MSPTFTKWLMSTSALLMALLGLAATFLPDELLAAAGAASSEVLALFIQVMGALYLGSAMLNWMARANVFGGIYNRPIVFGDLLHFLVAGIAMLKAALAGAGMPWLWVLTVVYLCLSAGFALVMFRHPKQAAETI